MQECLDGGSHRVPPRRRADGDDVVVGDVDGKRLELRLKARVHLVLALIDHIVVAAGVRHGGVEPHKIAAGDALQRFCGALGVAARLGVVNDQELFHFATSSAHWASALFASSTWLPWMARPFVTAAPWAALRMSFSVSERPLPSCVQKGWMVLPVKS